MKKISDKSAYSISVISASKKQTQKIAKELAENIIRLPLTLKALIITLKGDLGAGKTTFTQGFLRGLGVKSKITSPTFTLVKKYEIQIPKSKTPNSKARLVTGQANTKSKIKKYKTAYHLDCYRVNNYKEIIDLGFSELISNPQNIILIEWPERISRLLKQGSSKPAKILPKNKILVTLKHGKTFSERIIEIK